MRINLDYFNDITPPDYVLTKASGERIGVLRCIEKKQTVKFNEYNEISFTVFREVDGVIDPIYDKIVELQFVELPEIGRFIINSIDIDSESTEYESKNCTALSEEVTLAQKYLELFTINYGTTESIDGVQFYNSANTGKSLLHLVLEKCPDWSIGHVDAKLMTMHRSFEVSRTDVYSFLTSEVSEAFECIFVFDSLNHRVNVYAEDSIGENTGVYVSYNNLLKNANLSSSIDDIKTCLTVTGADELNLREVNMGQDRIYNLDYFHSLEYMTQGLYDAYALWVNKWNSLVDSYADWSSQYHDCYLRIVELESKLPEEVIPSDKTKDYQWIEKNVDWSEYGLKSLNQHLEAYEQVQTAMMSDGKGDEEHADYLTMYLPVYNIIQKIKSQITVVEADIAEVQREKDMCDEQMSMMTDAVSIKNNFTEEHMRELTKFIREDELSSDNYVVTDIMTEDERIDMLNDMLEYGRKELAKVSSPTLDVSVDMTNIFAMPEFQGFTDKVEPGNYIHVALRDDYILRLRLLTMDIDWYDISSLGLTFGNVMKLKGSKVLQDITDALKLATSAATSVSFNSSNWNKANQEANEISDMLASGLISAGQSIENSKSTIEIDERGMFVTSDDDSEWPEDSIFIGNGRILFSDDDFKTVKTAIGRCRYRKDGVWRDEFGLLADFVIAGYIAGSTIEGNEIIGGTITGTEFNNGNGTFKVDKDGNLTATSATLTGHVNAESGTIGTGSNVFTISATDTISKIYSGSKSTIDSTANGIYLGTDGISLGSEFSVNNKGEITATGGTIGGFTISDTYLANGTEKLAGAATSVYLGTDGISLGTTFQVSKWGTLTAKKGEIGGWTISTDELSNADGKIRMGDAGSGYGVCIYCRYDDKTYWSIREDGSALFAGKVEIIGNTTIGGDLTIKGTLDVQGSALTTVNNIVANNATVKKVSADVVTVNNELVATNASVANINARVGAFENLNVSNRLTAVEGKFDNIYFTNSKGVVLQAYVIHGNFLHMDDNTGAEYYLSMKNMEINGTNYMMVIANPIQMA